jgi:hypothetical protein
LSEIVICEEVVWGDIELAGKNKKGRSAAFFIKK